MCVIKHYVRRKTPSIRVTFLAHNQVASWGARCMGREAAAYTGLMPVKPLTRKKIQQEGRPSAPHNLGSLFHQVP